MESNNPEEDLEGEYMIAKLKGLHDVYHVTWGDMTCSIVPTDGRAILWPNNGKQIYSGYPGPQGFNEWKELRKERKEL